MEQVKKYLKRQNPVEAMQYTGSNVKQLNEWLHGTGNVYINSSNRVYVSSENSGGVYELDTSDFIIKLDDYFISVMELEVFEQEYKEVKDEQ